MDNTRTGRLAPLAGIPFLACFVAVLALDGGDLADSATKAEVLEHWSTWAETSLASLFIGFGAVLFLMVFVASLRATLRSQEPGEATVSSVMYAGGILAAGGLLVSLLLSMGSATLAEQKQTDALLALNAVSDNSWVPVMGGLVVFFLGAGLGALRTGAIPNWLGVIAIVLGVAGFTPLGVATFLLMPFWVVTTGVALYRRGRRSPGFATTAGTPDLMASASATSSTAAGRRAPR